MTTRPILFSTAMVQALRDGRKTQTRRIVKPQPVAVAPFQDGLPTDAYYGDWPKSGFTKELNCPYGQPGDLLYVKETFWAWSAWNPEMEDLENCVAYKADPKSEGYDRVRWSPSIFMPRRASRLTLRITEVRVERVQDISKTDAEAEGFQREPNLPIHPRDWFRNLWDSINVKRGFGWDENPWVWAISFEVIEGNVDEVEGE